MNTVQAETTCHDVIRTCDRALEEKEKEVKICDLGLKQTLEHNQELSSELESKQKSLEAWYRNPFVMLALGGLAGALTMGIVLK